MIHEIKEQVSIIDFIKSINIKIITKGGKKWCCCPLHKEDTPSCIVTEEKFYCFGCKRFGDIITIYQEYYNKTFSQAIKGIIEDFKLNIKSSFKSYTKEKEIMRQLCHHYMQNKSYIKEYCQKRHITNKIITDFKIGYAVGNHGINYLMRNKYHAQDIRSLGITNIGSIDFMRNRIIFPLLNRNGDVIGFSGRTLSLNVKPKYLHSKKTVLFNKSKYLYGEHLFQRDINHLILVEGHIDVFSLYTLGFKNVMSVMGTALSEDQCKRIFSRVSIIYLMFDQDKAGQTAIYSQYKNILSSLHNHASMYVVSWPKNHKDVDEYITHMRTQNLSSEQMFQTIQNCLKNSEYYIDWLEKYMTTDLLLKSKNLKKHTKLENYLHQRQIYKTILKHLKNPDLINYYQTHRFTYKKLSNSSSNNNYEERLLSILLHKPELIKHFSEELMRIKLSNQTFKLMMKMILTGVLNKEKNDNIIQVIKDNFATTYIRLKRLREPEYLLQNLHIMKHILYGLLSSLPKC